MQLISKKALDFKTQSKNLRQVVNLALTGAFIALYIVITQHTIVISSVLQLRLGFLIIGAASLYGGPLMGMTVGVIGDVLAFLVSGGWGAAFFPGFTITYAIMGFFFGLILYGHKMSVIRAGFGALVEFILSIFLNTYWLTILQGTTFIPLFLVRLPKSLIMLPVSWVLLFIVLRSLSHLYIHVPSFTRD